MDLSLVTGAVASLRTAKEIGSALLEARDFTHSATKIAEMNNLLLKAQESLFAHNAQLMELQQQNFETGQELRKLKKASAERGRYALFEISDGTFVYRSKSVPATSGSGEPVSPEPQHDLCQPCFDAGVKSVLQRAHKFGSILARCTICKAEFDTGETYPYGI